MMGILVVPWLSGCLEFDVRQRLQGCLMTALVIDGKRLAESVEQRIFSQVPSVSEAIGRAPKLAVVLAGDNPASRVYVASKSKRAKRCGMDTLDVVLSENISDEELQSELCKLNARDDVDGILLQLPLPAHLNEFAALMCISPEKDVDGLHPLNQGLLMRGSPAHRPCTPLGVMALIDEGRRILGQGPDLKGMKAVVVGRSVLVGKPVGHLLLDRHCTVTYCHSRTADLVGECRQADVLVAAVGRAEMLSREHVKRGAIVIDVGINRLPSGKLVGDVAYDDVLDCAGAITPVPGGVGPMTIAMLLSNTLDAARKKTRHC